MMLLSCSSNGDNEKIQTTDSLSLIVDGQETEFNERELSHENQKCKIDSLLPDEFALVGDIVIDDSLLINDPANRTINGVRILAEVMPEFIGGFDSLAIYIKENLKYPEWEKKADIQGKFLFLLRSTKTEKLLTRKY